MSRGRPFTTKEVQRSLQEGRNYKHLYRELKDKYDGVVGENKELRQLVAAQAATITEFKAEVKELKEEVQRLKDSSTKYKFYLFKDQKNGSTHGGGRPPLRSAASYVRVRPTENEITDRRELRLSVCPHCNGTVSSSIESYVTYVEDIVFAPQSVTQYTVHRHWCNRCKLLVHCPLPNALPGMSLGINTMLYVLTEHYRAKKTDEQIVESLERYFNLRVSSGEVSALRHMAARYFDASYQQIVAGIRTAAVIYADETGWLVQGHRHGQCWHVTAPEVPAILFKLADSRAKDELQSMLGPCFTGITVSDFYTVYDGVGSDQQKCWVHLLRDSSLSARASPNNKQRKRLDASLSTLYQSIASFRRKPWREKQAAQTERTLDTQLLQLADQNWHDKQCKRLAKRIHKYHHELLTCIRYPNVLPENNTAERGLRPVVVQRKITNGNRSAKGAHTYEVNMSVIETLRAERGNLLERMREVLWNAAWNPKVESVTSLG
jgi:transposase